MEVLIVMGSLFALLIALIIILAPMPGRIARKRNHPQAKVIKLCGWTSILTGTITAWVLALKWAHDDSPEICEDFKREMDKANKKKRKKMF